MYIKGVRSVCLQREKMNLHKLFLRFKNDFGTRILLSLSVSDVSNLLITIVESLLSLRH
jgi:hypothetical protein